MRIPQKAIAGLFFLVGIPVLALSLLGIASLSRQTSAVVKKRVTPMVALLGIPSTLAGGWLLWEAYDKAQRQERDRLRTVFLNLVKAGSGEISASSFAEATELDLNQSCRFLDDRAIALGGTSCTNDSGERVYVFQIGHGDTRSLLDDGTLYDVLLHAVPDHKVDEVKSVLQQIMGLDNEAVESLMDQPLAPLQKDVTRAIAEEYRHQLSAVEATVLIVLK